MVSRTLSKSYALAGLRFGFLVAQPHIIQQLVKVKDSYNCDALSIAASHGRHRRPGLAAADHGQDPGHAAAAGPRDARAWVLPASNRRRISSGTRTRQLPVKPLYERLKASQVLVRYMDYAGWGDGLRISVGSDDQIDACLGLLKTMV